MVRQNLLISVLITVVLVWSVLQGINDKLWIGVLVHEASAVLVILNGARMAGSDGMLTLLRNIFIDLKTLCHRKTPSDGMEIDRLENLY